MQKFTIEKDGFYLNGEPFRVLAGAIHYFRVPAEYWRDRLLKLKACGFNTVETYVAWNCHQKNEDAFDFSENNNVEAFDFSGEILPTAKNREFWDKIIFFDHRNKQETPIHWPT